MAALAGSDSFVVIAVTYAVNAAWQVPLVPAAAWAAARVVRRMGPQAVHRVWAGALLLAAALPACGFVNWGAAVSHLWQSPGAGSGSVRVAVLPGTAGAGGALQWPPWLLETLFAFYGASILYAAARFLWALRRVGQARRQAEYIEPQGELKQRWNELRSARKNNHVRMAESPCVAGPMVLGVRHPLLLTPVGFFARVARADRDAALAHELAHVQRRDYAKNLAYSVLTLPIAWHPCLWLLRAKVAESREMVCDAMAAEAIGGSREYARALLRLAGAFPMALRGQSLPAMGIFDGNTLERRVTNMMDKRKKLSGAARFAAIVAAALLTVGAGASTMAMHMDVMAANGAAKAPKIINVSSGTMDADILFKPNPVYPPEAKAKHEQGTVTLAATINRQGVIKSLRLVKSAGTLLDKSAWAAVSQWRYKPYLLNGDPVEVQTTIHVTYTLGK